MDNEELKPDCQKCEWWSDRVAKCRLPVGRDCPQGISRPQQEQAEVQTSILG